MSVMLTPAQARALAALAERAGPLVLHQLAHSYRHVAADDLYATPQGAAEGYRITSDGSVSAIGETLPADAEPPPRPPR